MAPLSRSPPEDIVPESVLQGIYLGVSSAGPAFWEWPGMSWRSLKRRVRRIRGLRDVADEPADGSPAAPSS